MHLRLIIGVFLLTSLAMAQGNLPPPKDGTTIYVVKPGDTLWDISGRFYNNPLLWPRLWEINSFIDNPNLIYPGDVLSLKQKPPDIPVVKVEPKPHKVSLKDMEAPPPVYYYSRGGTEGFISPERWKHMGTLLTSEPPKILLGTGDIVYTNVGVNDGVSTGDKFTIFRTSKEVFHPFTNNRIGYKVAILGELEIIEVIGERKSIAVITESYREITRGARIRPQEPFVTEVILKKGVERVDGVVVATKNNVNLSGRGDIVYLDRGKSSDVVAGNTFSVYTTPRKVYDPDAGKRVVIPGALIGKIVVIYSDENSSTGLITQSSRQIEIGDIVSLDI